ncbi:MAG: hypothetical protein ABSF64_09430 [Bryobacteraceae bacterium]
MKIKRKTSIALHIDEKLVVRTRRSSGGNTSTFMPCAAALQEGPVSKSETKKDLPPCKDK